MRLKNAHWGVSPQTSPTEIYLKGDSETERVIIFLFTPLILSLLSFLLSIYLSIPSFYQHWQDSELGAQTIIHLAVAEEVEGVTGKYFDECKVRTTHTHTHVHFTGFFIYTFKHCICFKECLKITWNKSISLHLIEQHLDKQSWNFYDKTFLLYSTLQEAIPSWLARNTKLAKALWKVTERDVQYTPNGLY